MTRSSMRAGTFVLSLGLVAGLIAGTVSLKDAVTAEPPQVTEVKRQATRVDDYIDRATLDNYNESAEGSQLTFVRLSDGAHIGSPTERFPRPALSLIKLYIADYVLDHGEDVDKVQALEMIRASDDFVAEELVEKYPSAIADTARKYGLWSTYPGDRWGTSYTSTYDVVKFVRAKIEHEPDSELLLAMRQGHEVAYDGYEQNFGTATLPGAKGTKWGWSDGHDLHSSISFGDDYVVAAAVQGSAEDLTALVRRRVEPVLAR